MRSFTSVRVRSLWILQKYMCSRTRSVHEPFVHVRSITWGDVNGQQGGCSIVFKKTDLGKSRQGTLGAHPGAQACKSWKKTLARNGRGAALGVGLTAHLVAAAACAGQCALLTRRPARWAVLRRPSVRVAFVTTCANSAVQSA